MCQIDLAVFGFLVQFLIEVKGQAEDLKTAFQKRLG